MVIQSQPSKGHLDSTNCTDRSDEEGGNGVARDSHTHDTRCNIVKVVSIIVILVGICCNVVLISSPCKDSYVAGATVNDNLDSLRAKTDSPVPSPALDND